MCTHELVQPCGLLRCFTTRVKFLGCQSGNQRTRKGHSIDQANRADFNFKSCDRLGRFLSLMALWGNSIHHYVDGLTGCFHKIKCVRDRFHVENRRPARNQNQVGNLCGFQGRAVGVRRGVENE